MHHVQGRIKKLTQIWTFLLSLSSGEATVFERQTRALGPIVCDGAFYRDAQSHWVQREPVHWILFQV